MLVAIPIRAEATDTRASSYFASYDSFLWKTGGTTFEVWFDVNGCAWMDEIGVSSIKVQRSSDGENWTTMKTYLPENYSQMICEDTSSHTGCVAYTGTPGYYYRAYVTFYAKNSTGTGIRYDYAETIRL
jgi:hypothetical protein